MSEIIEKQHAATSGLSEDNRNHRLGESQTDVKPSDERQADYLAELNAREDALLRYANGIRDAVVYPRLREMGVAEPDLHRVAMRMVRRIQWTRDFDGATAKLLGVVPCGINGTAAAPEVV